MDTLRPRLIVLPGGKKALPPPGPVTRMGLWNRTGQPTARQWMWIAGAKLVLLAAILYGIFG